MSQPLLSRQTQSAPAAVTPQAFSVSEINAIVADLLRSGLPGTLQVQGEISNLSTAASGHRYLSLKDAHSTISCALFRGAANRINRALLNGLKNGDKVVVKAGLSVYQPRGNYQLIIHDIEPAGFGELAKAFAALKAKLDAAGITADARKRPLPAWPRAIAVITSASGAAIRDILSTLKRRAAFIPVTIYPTQVQGNTAPDSIIRALQAANQNNHAEVIILARGGGSLEDLHAFNDEQVALAVADSRLPIITGVGHETDFSIVDFVSDYRAPTPTGAAEVASPDAQALTLALYRQRQRLHTVLATLNRQHQQQLHTLTRRLNVQHPQQRLQQQSQRLDELTQRLQRLQTRQLYSQRQQLRQLRQRLFSNNPQYKQRQIQQQLTAQKTRLGQALTTRLTHAQNRLDRQQHRLQHSSKAFAVCRQQLKGLEARLTLLSPLGQLTRGYALAFHENGELLHRAAETHVGQRLRIRLADGDLYADITQRILTTDSTTSERS